MFERVCARLSLAYARFLSEGFLWSLVEVVIRLINFVAYVLLLPGALLLRFLGYRFLSINASRIGHLAGEVDCFIKLQSLGLIDVRYKYVVFSNSRICNKVFWGYVKKRIHAIDSPSLCKILKLMTLGPGVNFDVSSYILSINQSAKYYDVCRLWSDREPVFKIEKEHFEVAQKRLHEMGVPIGAEYVCIHVRSMGYYKEDDRVHENRNFSNDSLVKSINEIVSRGFYCIVMGDLNSPQIPSSKGVINYAHSPFKSDLMDVFLCANAKFFLGNSSGLFILSTVFGVPCALCNMLPFVCTGFTSRDLSIPKLIRKLSGGTYLNYKEIIRENIANFRSSKQYERSGVVAVSNSEDDIYGLVSEMLDRLDGKLTSDEILRDNEPFLVELQSMHYSYGTSSYVAPSFMRKYAKVFRA